MKLKKRLIMQKSRTRNKKNNNRTTDKTKTFLVETNELENEIKTAITSIKKVEPIENEIENKLDTITKEVFR